MKKESGFVLVTGMVFLAVLTIIVIYMLRGSIMQERMTANSIDRQRALQAADAVLREAEDRVAAGGVPFDPFVIERFSPNCTTMQGLCRKLSETASLWSSVSWSTANSVVLSGLTLNKVNKPNYVIELIVPPENKPGVGCDAAIYRIVANGTGKMGAGVVLQSYMQITPAKCP